MRKVCQEYSLDDTECSANGFTVWIQKSYSISMSTTKVIVLIISIQATGEAEAELARLNSSGRMDSILSNDIDTFLFGGIQVI